jgi:F-type H+-transporting ATPase subunit b
MRNHLRRQLCLTLLFAFFTVGLAWSQEGSKPAAPAESQPSAQSTQPAPSQTPVNPDAAIGRDLSKASEQAEHAEEGEGHAEHDNFKYSSMVQRLGRLVGLGPRGMYWVSLAVNFIILALFFWMLLKSKLPAMFRNRSISIQKALKEAHEASAEASRRLGDIEARLAKLDSEVSDIKAGAERESVAEEERVRAAAEEDKRKVVDAAEAEIAAIARTARHDLKGFAASLAVDIASHKIKVDDNTDQALVRQFVTHLGKDGE